MKVLGLCLFAVSLLCLPQSAFATCRQYSITLPDGKILMCQDCNGQVICT